MGALLIAAVFGACGGGEGGPAATVTDSAGVTIVEYGTWAPESLPWRIGAEPLVQIGALEGEDAYQFDQIGGVARLSDGRIVVASGGTQDLRYFDSTGRHLRSVGGKGEGPGEFQSMGVLEVLPGDSVGVYDWNLQRVSFFDPSGAFVRSFLLQHSAGVDFPVGRFADGSWLMQPAFVFSPGDPGATVVRDTSRLLVFADDGTFRDSAGRWIGPDFYLRSEGGKHASAASLPFGRMTEVAVSGLSYYEGYTDRYEIARRGRSGAADLVIRASRTATPVTDADVAAHKAARLEGTAQVRQEIERLYQDIPFPNTMPAFTDLRVDADGNLWVLEVSRPGDERRRWTVFDAEGRMLGAIETPPAVSIREIGRDYLLGTWTDDLDVEYVRMYRLSRGAAP